MEATGTVIGPDGLTVLALSSTDPMSMMQDMMGGMFGDDLDMASQVSDAKILEQDGTELAAEIVLRDKDLDLAFVRPVEKPAEAMPCVNLEDAAAPEIFDEVVVLDRLGKSGQPRPRCHPRAHPGRRRQATHVLASLPGASWTTIAGAPCSRWTARWWA